MTHWAIQYIGDAWVHGEHDCWGFFRRVQKEVFNRDVPVVDVDAFNLRQCIKEFKGHDERSRWQLIDQPVEGCAVLLSQSTQPTHVGLWVDVDGGGVLHCVQGNGVVFSTRSALSQYRYNLLGFYKALY